MNFKSYLCFKHNIFNQVYIIQFLIMAMLNNQLTKFLYISQSLLVSLCESASAQHSLLLKVTRGLNTWHFVPALWISFLPREMITGFTRRELLLTSSEIIPHSKYLVNLTNVFFESQFVDIINILYQCVVIHHKQ